MISKLLDAFQIRWLIIKYSVLIIMRIKNKSISKCQMYSRLQIDMNITPLRASVQQIFQERSFKIYFPLNQIALQNSDSREPKLSIHAWLNVEKPKYTTVIYKYKTFSEENFLLQKLQQIRKVHFPPPDVISLPRGPIRADKSFSSEKFLFSKCSTDQKFTFPFSIQISYLILPGENKSTQR